MFISRNEVGKYGNLIIYLNKSLFTIFVDFIIFIYLLTFEQKFFKNNINYKSN